MVQMRWHLLHLLVQMRLHYQLAYNIRFGTRFHSATWSGSILYQVMALVQIRLHYYQLAYDIRFGRLSDSAILERVHLYQVMWDDIAGTNEVAFVAFTGTNEVALSSCI